MLRPTYIILYFCAFLSVVWTLSLGNHRNVKLPVSSGIDGRVFGGADASPGQFPWVASIVYTNVLGNTWACGGSIISEHWILTSAQCAALYYEPLASGVSVGTTDYFGNVGEVSLFNHVIFHEDYNPLTLENDIAVLDLFDPLTFNENVSAVALPSEPLEAGVNVTVTGWGGPADTPYQTLQYATVTTIENSECAIVYGENVVHEETVCTAAGDPAKGVCVSDGGYGAVVNADSDPVVVAIVSFLSQRGCDNGDPSGYTRVAPYRDWINEKTGL